MTFEVRMEIEVDTQAWEEEYGPQNLKRDVEDYILNQLTASAAAESGLLKVTAYAVSP
jgi:hypothetical protein